MFAVQRPANLLAAILALSVAQANANPTPPGPVFHPYPLPPMIRPPAPPAPYWMVPPPLAVPATPAHSRPPAWTLRHLPRARPQIAGTSGPPGAAQGQQVESPPVESASVELSRLTPKPAVPATGDEGSPGSSRQAFLDTLIPIVQRANARLAQRRAHLASLLRKVESTDADDATRAEITRLARSYRVHGNPLHDAEARAELLRKVDEIPLSLALAQAANESAWGTSRFAREGNNLFGIWTYDETQGMVPRGRAAGERHLVRRFDSLQDSVDYYLHNLNSHPAYRPLREARAAARARGEQPAGMALAAGLIRYSAKGEEYVRLIRSLIQRYDLATLGSTSSAG